MKKINRSTLFRVLFYLLGLLVLALGLTLNTKTGLGVSPIISVAYSISVISGQNFGNMTLVLYSLFVVIQICILSAAGGRPVRREPSLPMQTG